ncbi:elongation factor 3 [Candida albicans P60002]|uniref:Elf1p n=5 Tax=Candida albicans TaxID=5476 RepID=A0A1D8PTY4_CANAL|nr:Elf1p [Candida albicans SC5314]EEQ43951.1 mRNA export factor elf1 [Candida albicans WO-1]KAF6068744.1 ABC transporter family protein [Candida albicans]KGQ80865.1 elongation factor 3 [Candida albicans P37005]KGR00625.1 elongation factor 3 [Candida albicans P78048]KGR05278.1 elongation factor 3 [Candida albicans P37037]KGT62854.1 elongation factor 3 [Candida albicans 12C]KGU00738.1 elongation factor 3 [Candida albicans 19F]KHC42719.1 elongation factor 3 [Candida albicans P60002]KHC44203.1|eukprot:XP_716466.1 Elf1p [Candida albicans SC5314]
MSKSFDDFIKQQKQQQSKPKGFGYRNNNQGGYNYNQAYGNVPTFQPGNQQFQYQGGYNQGFNQQQYQYQGQGYNNQGYNSNNRYNNSNNYNYNNNTNQSSTISTPVDSLPTSGRSTPNPNASTTSLTSLNTALAKLNVSNIPFEENLSNIEKAGKIAEIRPEVETIVKIIDEQEDLSIINEWKLNEILKSLLKPKSPALVKEGALLIIQQLATKFGGQTPKEAYLLQFLSTAYDMFTDKDKNVVKAAKSATDALFGIYPVEALGSIVLDEYLTIFKSGAKWNSKVAALVNFDKLIDDVPADILEMKFIDVVPVLTDLSTDFKPELAKAGLSTLKKFVKVLDNLDLQNKYDLIVDTLADPKKVTDCIKNLSSVTFVAEVTEPALSLLVPILDKSLKMSSSSNEQLRQTVMVTENLTRLVNNKREIEQFIPILLPGVEKVVNNASLPEVRELAGKALKVLKDAENEQTDGKFHGRITLEQAEKFYTEDIPDEQHQQPVQLLKDDILKKYLATVLQIDAHVNDWKRLQEYLMMATNNNETYSQLVVTHVKNLFNPESAADNENDDGAVVIVDADFSLAYGTRMLLNKTKLRLLKGHRYGLCGRNGAGKSTLMRAISKGQLEGFPTADELKTCFVEHKLQGSEADMDLVSFIGSDPELANVGREEIEQALKDVGFPDERLQQQVGSLSGGWKMKLELARAMLMKADVLLLDEPTNHLDVANVKWLQDYLVENTEITSLIVSHDSGFLDAVCTDIIHYENKKLAYYKGNLSEFVKIKPEGKSYYTLTDSNVKMAFPPPGILTGVKSNTRAVARMSNVTFAYPGADKPSLKNVSCSLSLSSRVAILGPNGAGKSTLIKLLTAELVPQEGKVEKHPNLRIGYIAQHALQHVEQHKEKTANQYLQWRYRFGDDREVLLKESRKVSDEEQEMMKKEIDIGDGRGKRAIEALVGRQKLKKSFQYEVKWKYWLPKYNSWVPKEVLLEHGFDKLIQKFDDHEASREGLGYRELTPSVIRKHFEDVGLDGDIADHTPMGSLSGGQLVKVVIAGAMWNNPHLLVLDEPTNYLDRDSLGGLAMAIREWNGGVVMISHNNEFVGALCPEQWHVENGEVIQKGTVAVDAKRFEDQGGDEASSSKEGTPVPEPVKKRADDDDSPANIKVRTRKKKMTRNEKKAQAERRRLRYIEWLSSPKGTPKPVDTDDEED